LPFRRQCQKVTICKEHIAEPFLDVYHFGPYGAVKEKIGGTSTMDDREITTLVESIKTLIEEATVPLGELAGLRPHNVLGLLPRTDLRTLWWFL
jgi:hypothetical protein